jgi:hypothetical protein
MPDPPIVIPTPTDRYKASNSVEREGRGVINCDLEDDAFSAATTGLDAHDIQKGHTYPVPPPLGQNPKRQDLAFVTKVEGQEEPGRHLVPPSDSPENSWDADYLADRWGIPWIFGEACAVQHRQGTGHDA